MLEKKGEIEKAFSMDERLSGRLDDSGEGTLGKFYPVLRIRIRGIRKILASWIRIGKNMRITDPDPRGKISTKNCKKIKFYS